MSSTDGKKMPPTVRVAAAQILSNEEDGKKIAAAATTTAEVAAAAVVSNDLDNGVAEPVSFVIDWDSAQRTNYAIEQLSSVFGFDWSVARQAVDAVGTDLTTAYNYILDQNLGTDQGGPIVLIDNCPHVSLHVKIKPPHLSFSIEHVCCEYNKDKANEEKAGNPKSDREQDGSCPPGENWVCLQCGAVRCSRYVNGHALQHYNETKETDEDGDGVGHCVTASLGDFSVWCHECSAYLRNPCLDPLIDKLEELKFGGKNAHAGTNQQEERNEETAMVRKKHEGAAAKEAPQQDQLKEGRSASSTLSSDMVLSPIVPGDPNQEDIDECTTLSSLDMSAVQRQTPGGTEQEEELLFDSGELTLALLHESDDGRGTSLDQRVFNDTTDEEDEDEDHSDNSDNSSVEYPFGTLPNNLQQIADFILSDKCQSIMILAGAGMSVVSGIPDFRSAGGLYDTLQPDLLTASEDERELFRADPTAALSKPIFLQNPLPCLELMRPFLLGIQAKQWKATLAHRFVELLHSKTGKLTRLYTQNIDGLEGHCHELPRDKVIAVHGSMDQAECAICGSSTDYRAFCNDVRQQVKDISDEDSSAPDESTPIDCHVCGCAAVKPSIVMFRSNLPEIFWKTAPKDVKDVDLLLVIGTSLTVAPANSLVFRVPDDALRVIVNRDKVGRHLGVEYNEEDSTRDYFALGDIDETILDLMCHLGWLNDLADLMNDLPEISATLLSERLESEKKNNTLGTEEKVE